MSYIDRDGKYHYAGNYPDVPNPFHWDDDEYEGREQITDSDTMFFYYDGQLLGKCNADYAECSGLLELMRNNREVATGVLNYLNSLGDPVFPVSDEDWGTPETNIDNVDIYELYSIFMQELDYQYSDWGEVYVDGIPGVEIWTSDSSEVVATTKITAAAEEETVEEEEDEYDEEDEIDYDEGDDLDHDEDEYLDDDELLGREWYRSHKLKEKRDADDEEDEEDDIEGSTNINAYFFLGDVLREAKLKDKQAAELDEDEEDDITGDTKYFATMVNASTSNAVNRIIKFIQNGNMLSLDPEVRQELSEVSVSDFYTSKYPDDELGPEIKDITFADLFDTLNYGEDVYDAIGTGDSLVRERLFAELATLTGLDYDVVYSLWLYS